MGACCADDLPTPLERAVGGAVEQGEGFAVAEEGDLAGAGGNGDGDAVGGDGNGAGGGVPGAESAGELFEGVAGGEHGAGGFDHPISIDDKGAVDGGEFLDGFVHEGAEDVAVFLDVTKKWIQNEWFGVRVDLFAVADDQNAADGFSFAPLDGQFGGDAKGAFEYFGADAGGEDAAATVEENGGKFAGDIDHENGVNLVAAWHAADAADAVGGLDDAAHQADEQGAAELGQAVVGERADDDGVGGVSRIGGNLVTALSDDDGVKGFALKPADFDQRGEGVDEEQDGMAVGSDGDFLGFAG